MTTDPVRRRPGGRSAKVRSAVTAATVELLAESGPEKLTIAEVAARAGVHETSIYRRWKTRERLVLDSMIELSSELLAVPDTGSLRGDLVALGQKIVGRGTSPLGSALVRGFAAHVDDADAARTRHEFWENRLTGAEVMMERARARGELPAHVDSRTLLELFVSPIHFRLLLTRQPVDSRYLERIADITVAGAAATPPT
ncbi:TetR/AcrR family transcriptional regulator [Streptomyces hyaluromycini]|uniref:TetR/AcrR family transcriptional regulator n=1 Tax=Streptomyces hyaluromycini TaxID=1377993 RepID=UPI000B5CAA75|nr:TetR/AcrR family transcriptional regulator [Streptomyces hyaluromycini]